MKLNDAGKIEITITRTFGNDVILTEKLFVTPKQVAEIEERFNKISAKKQALHHRMQERLVRMCEEGLLTPKTQTHETD